MTRLSIIIPSLTGDESLDVTLASVLQNRPSQCEVLVVHAGQYDDPYELGSEVRFLQQPSDVSLSHLINAGVQVAQSDIVHVLLCGTEVEEGWTEPVLRHFHDPTVASVAPHMLQSLESENLIAGGVAYRFTGRRLVKKKILGPTLTAAFYRKAVFESLGRLDHGVGDCLADVDVALSMSALGYRCVSEPQSRVFTQEPPVIAKSGPWRRGREQERLFRKHAETVGKVRSRIAHSWTLLIECLATSVYPPMGLKLLGRIISALQRAPYREHARRLHNAARSVATDQPSKVSSQFRIDSAHRPGSNRAVTEIEKSSGS